MRVNKKSISRLHGTAKKTLGNFGKNTTKIVLGATLVISLTVGMTEPVFAQSYPDYAYVPYNRDWGNKNAFHKITVSVMDNTLGIVRKEEANHELQTAIYDCLGQDKVEKSKYDTVTFQLVYDSPNVITIDRSSFSFYKKKTTTLDLTQKRDVYLPVRVFMAPDGQQWIDERNYTLYASDKNIIYQCSDGSLAHSYQEFKDWECELAYRPTRPIYPIYPECKNSLTGIGYLEVSEDGTIWKDQTVLEEYLHWKQDKNYNVKDGVYFGAYGICSSFEDYVRLYNISYYVNAGLKREEQFYGAYGFLYISKEKAQDSIDKVNGYQKVIEK